jgi:hypothetical protein
LSLQADEAFRVAKIKEEQVAQLERISELEAAASQRTAELAAADIEASQTRLQAIKNLADYVATNLPAAFKKGSKEQAAAEKASALFAIAVNTARGISLALGSLPPPVSFVAAGAVGALGAAQAAQVASQSVPSFDRGGVVDGGPAFPGGSPRQRLAQVEDGEVILTRRQQEALRGGGGATTVVLTLGARELKRVVVGSGLMDGVQKRRGFGQRRYGG